MAPRPPMCLRLRLSFLASILVLVARLAGHIAATASVHVPVDTDRLRECVAEAMLGKKFRQVADSLFHLYYGDAAVEVFNVLSGHQMKAVEFLAQCVQQEQPDLVEDSITPFRHSGGRITYLTGIVQALFPDVLPKLLLAADYGLHKAEWEGADLGKLGVRAAYLVDVDEGGMEDYKRQLKEQKTKKGSAFVIAPHDVAELERKRAQSSFTDVKDPHADDVVVDFLESHHGSTFTLLVMLTDQNKYVGGDILVHKKRRDGSVGFSDPQPVENDVYEDEEDEDLLANDNRETHDIEIGQYRRFNAKTTEISRFAPDKGSMLLIDCQHDFGTMELLHGSRKVLIVELWEYNDSPLGSRVPSEEEGVKLGMKISNFAFDL